MFLNFLKSLLHNAGVVIVGFAIAFLGTKIDLLFVITDFKLAITAVAGWLLLALGFALRVWATFYFYQRNMKVIVLAPQSVLVTKGPFSFTRNPLYLGGNVFIFLGAALVLGSPAALIITAVAIPVTNVMIKREEKQLEEKFGREWLVYKKNVPRWL